MDAALRIVRVQILSWADVGNGSISMAHPISDRIPIVAPFAVEFFGLGTAWFTVAVRISRIVSIMRLGTDGHNARKQCQKNDGCNWQMRN